MNWTAIADHISTTLNIPFQVQSSKSIGGGSINSAYLISNDKHQFFAKLNSPRQQEMFAAEAEGLVALNNAQAIRAPSAICWGGDGDHSYIVMDYIQTGGRGSQSLLGQQMAQLHRFTENQYGWHRDNTIGATPQINRQNHHWVDFYRDMRLSFQLELAARNGYSGRLQRDGEVLLENIDAFFRNYTPPASLLHGDLWSGNYSFDQDGNPVIFDPAVYYGDRETDIAMTELFGGFSGEFYAAYNDTYPLDEDYAVRKTLYNLYHIINHLNLFGSGYLGQAESMLSRLLSQIR